MAKRRYHKKWRASFVDEKRAPKVVGRRRLLHGDDLPARTPLYLGVETRLDNGGVPDAISPVASVEELSPLGWCDKVILAPHARANRRDVLCEGRHDLHGPVGGEAIQLSSIGKGVPMSGLEMILVLILLDRLLLTLVLDTPAFIKRYLDEEGTALVLKQMADDSHRRPHRRSALT